jgi:Eco57I restriction-modification methylase
MQVTELSHTHDYSFSSEQQSKRFYHYFKSEHASMLRQLHGILNDADSYAYTTALLLRLLVLYFLQSQGLLDNDIHYLSHHLQHTQKRFGQNCFYREYLLPLFRILYTGSIILKDQTSYFGNLPTLALPLLQPTPLELSNQHIILPDSSFLHLFHFFDTFQWQLDTQLQLGQDTLQPSVLAYIFEHQSDQKLTGTYYTQEDIATYIVSATILPRLLSMVAEELPDMFNIHAPCWHLLSDDPDRYIHTALRTASYLPEETEREYTLRQRRYDTLLVQLRTGSIHCIGDLITNNLDLQRFTLDILVTYQQVHFLVVFFEQLEQLTILDPTCGSGAFLVAALQLLQPIYTHCLEYICTLISTSDAQLDETLSTHHATYKAGQALLKRIEKYPTHQQYILTTILIYNLYGVDLAPEAINICQLRLYLAFLASAHCIEEVQPFSTLHLHMRVGNVLASTIEDKRSSNPKYASRQKEKITQQSDAEYTHQPFYWRLIFPEVFTREGFEVIVGNPPYLEHNKVKQYYLIDGHEEKSCGNIYTAILERSLALCKPDKGYLGFIVPISLCSSQRFEALRQKLIYSTAMLWLANFDIFPSRLFEGAFQRHTILLTKHQSTQTDKVPSLHVTRIHRWYSAERPYLFPLMHYIHVQTIPTSSFIFPKLAASCQETLLQKVRQQAHEMTISTTIVQQATPHFVYYQEATNYWTKALCHIPFYKKNGLIMPPPHGRRLFFANEQTAHSIMAILNSSLFYIWFSTYSDGFHLSQKLVRDFPLSKDLLFSSELQLLSRQLEADILHHARSSSRNTRYQQTPLNPAHSIEIVEYYMRLSKPILDDIDRVLAEYYNFTQAELDFIIYYESKHRIARRQQSNDSIIR